MRPQTIWDRLSNHVRWVGWGRPMLSYRRYGHERVLVVGRVRFDWAT